MFAGRKEIEEYAKNNNIVFKEDSSNISLKYLRNKIRHKLIPSLKELNPDIIESVKSNIIRIRQIENVLQKLVEEKRKEIVKEEKNLIKFDIQKLLALQEKELFLYEFLKTYGFSGNIIEKISTGLKATSGKQFYSATHRLVKDRAYLILTPIAISETEEKFIITENTKEIKKPLHLKFKKENIAKGFKITKDHAIAMFDMDKLNFPLTIRKWEKGDAFCPFGMKGRKKLSNFFTDIKLSLIEKENTYLLCSGKDIAWVAGYRIDNRYRVTDKTKKIFVVKHITKQF
jgi:tRNA(Ile)-lysidine synthase